ncbi:DNA/RNA non-specific endonuclease [uncultured Sphingomonas sp.]|uniref:DNA/RNA non-specific endonuclease n=1 Tax=uncultured Sphingomonas sp. TaxID=158754 RepID=UPI00338EA64C
MFSPHGLRGGMTYIPDGERRRAFSIWLRTGRFPFVPNADGVELKFNPWHDPGTGRFTFVGAGQRHGQWGDGGFPGGGGGRGGGGGATGSGDWSAGLSRRKPQNPARGRTPKVPAQTAASADHAASIKSSAHEPFPEGTWTSGGFVGGGGGSFRGAGASGTWGVPDPKRRPSPSPGSATAGASSDRVAATHGTTARLASTPSEEFRTVVRNGYAYQIEARGRTRRVSGTLTIAESPRRSRTSQRQAGGTERRASDDGGHYIAVRFDGPTDAFNHFAQDRHFNRGATVCSRMNGRGTSVSDGR